MTTLAEIERAIEAERRWRKDWHAGRLTVAEAMRGPTVSYLDETITRAQKPTVTVTARISELERNRLIAACNAIGLSRGEALAAIVRDALDDLEHRAAAAVEGGAA